MTTKNINGRELVFVEVPEGAIKFYISNLNEIRYTCKPPHKMDWHSIEVKLPEGEFKTIGKASSLSEEQWAGIVESCVIIGFDFFYNGFVDYTKTQAGYFKTTESGLSLLSSLGMKPGTTLLLIKEK